MPLNFTPALCEQNLPRVKISSGLSPTVIPASQISLSGNYQGAVFISTSHKEEIWITMATAASEEWLVSQLSDLSTSFECIMQWHISKGWASAASYIHWKKQRVIQSSQPKYTLLFMLVRNHYCMWIPLDIV